MIANPKRRWPSFTLRTLLALVAVVGILDYFYRWAIPPEVEQVSFDPIAWKRAEPIGSFRTVRSQMIDDLLRRYDFQGWTREEVIQLLGTPNTVSGFTQFDVVYVLGLERGGAFSQDDEALGFKFDANGRVVNYRVTVH
jgi:hypothetical protein